MKKLTVIITLTLTVLTVSAVFITPTAYGAETSAEAHIIMHVGTGRVIDAKNADLRLPMASTTKIMTALIALERGNLNEYVTVSNKAANVEGSSMYLIAGEKIKLIDLVYGLMLNSGNDAAVAIAEHISKNVNEFAVLMTDRAKELGANNTSFKNPNGLDEPEHYTTARDLCTISVAAIKNPKFKEICSTKSTVLHGENTHYLRNHNKLLWQLEGADGIKTGFTKASGRTLVSSATRDGMSFAAVTLNAPSDWADHTALMEYAFKTYNNETVLKKHQRIGELTSNNTTVGVVSAQDVSVCVRQDEGFSVEPDLSADVPPIIIAGEVLGEAKISVGGKEICSVPLVAENTVINESWWKFDRSFGAMVREILLIMQDGRMFV